MKKLILILFVALFLPSLIFCQEVRTVTPAEAYEMGKKADTYLIDVRTIAEYVYVGHPENAYCLPLLFWDEREQTQVRNTDFLQKLVSSFKKGNKVVFICRSGNRSLVAARMAMDNGFQKVFHVDEGFEGKKDDRGYRTIGGWKNRGLPFTYELKAEFIL